MIVFHFVDDMIVIHFVEDMIVIDFVDSCSCLQSSTSAVVVVNFQWMTWI